MVLRSGQGLLRLLMPAHPGGRIFVFFKKQTIDRSLTRVLALLNIVGTGMTGRFEEQDVTDMNPVQTAHMIKKLFPDIIVGIKAAHYWGDFTQVDRAVEAGNLANVPVMVDFGEHDPPLSIEDLIMKHLRPGDILHILFPMDRPTGKRLFDENSKVKPIIFEAQKRGIIFDVGHGGGAFSWRQAIPSMQQGFKTQCNKYRLTC
jgi:dihydroorotase